MGSGSPGKGAGFRRKWVRPLQINVNLSIDFNDSCIETYMKKLWSKIDGYRRSGGEASNPGLLPTHPERKFMELKMKI